MGVLTTNQIWNPPPDPQIGVTLKAYCNWSHHLGTYAIKEWEWLAMRDQLCRRPRRWHLSSSKTSLQSSVLAAKPHLARRRKKHHKYKQATMRPQSFNVHCVHVFAVRTSSSAVWLDLACACILWRESCEVVHEQWQQTCSVFLGSLCMLYMHHPSTSLHIKETGIAGNESRAALTLNVWWSL